ncbi:MAG: hypothetical protein IPL86_10630 [Flavobacteriales bacterium]|nr:hypothetical protein [Flavobacteriales bacterium]
MRTFTLLSIAASFALSTSVSAQLPRIVVDGITAPQVFTDLNAAITAAPANSNITLSGGSFLVPGGFALDKPLHFVGAGMHPDPTLPARLRNASSMVCYGATAAPAW